MPKAFSYFSLVMSLIFIGFGIVIPIYPPQVLGDATAMHYVLGAVLIAYGIFRFTRAYKVLKSKDE